MNAPQPTVRTNQGPDFSRRAWVPAAKIALVYLLISSLWILLSDYAATYVVQSLVDPQMTPEQRYTLQYHIEVAKGLGFMLVTALLLFLLVRSYLRSMLATERAGQEALEKLAAEFQLLFESNPLPMWVVDTADLRVIEANALVTRLLGYSREEFIGMRTMDMLAPEEHARLRAVAADFSKSPPVPMVWRFRRKDGEVREVEITGHVVALNGRKGRLLAAVDVTQRQATERALDGYRRELEHRVAERTEDLSRTNLHLSEEVAQRRRAEDQLRQAKGAAEAASDAKSSFLARTTHEIRLPLTAILGYADLILDHQPPGAGCRRHAEVIRQNATRLLTLIEDLLDLSRIEAGRLHVRPAPVALRTLLGEIIDLFGPQSAGRNLSLSLEVADDLPEVIRTDPARLRQILVNLVGNAVKFTSEGAVTLAARPEGIDRVVIAVRDTGPGVPYEKVAELFKPFYQVAPDAPQGTGLGLAISQQLAELLGGSISVTNLSGQGHGAVFSLTIPVGIVGADPSAPAATGSLDLSVLLAEDDPHIRWLVSQFLEKAGATVTAVASGTDAVSTLRQAQAAGRPFEMIVVDMHMPGLSGPQTAAAIRELGCAAPIIGLTASADPADRDALTAAGCNAVAYKPIDRRTLLSVLAQHAPGR